MVALCAVAAFVAAIRSRRAEWVIFLAVAEGIAIVNRARGRQGVLTAPRCECSRGERAESRHFLSSRPPARQGRRAASRRDRSATVSRDSSRSARLTFSAGSRS